MIDHPPAPPLDEERLAFVEACEQQLFAAGASFSEQAFSIGCSAVTIPALLVLLITFVLGNRSWVGLAITGIILSLLALALVNLFAIQARNGAVRRAYLEKILPQIDAHLAEHQSSLAEFQQAARQALPQEALLLKNLSNPPSAEVAQAKE